MTGDKVEYGGSNDFVFREAASFLREKEAADPAKYRKLSDAYKSRAFSVAGYASLEVLNQFLGELDRAVEEGGTKERFRERMNTYLRDNGYAGINHSRSDNIFRTNMQAAYNAGHYVSMSEPAVKKLRPYWKYVTAGDGGVRDSHAAMDDRVFAADDPIWDIWYPPNGFGCRCQVVTLSRNQFERGGYRLEKEMPYQEDHFTGKKQPCYPDKGFSNNPAKEVWQPDLSGFPASLRRAYKERKEANGEEL